MTDLVMTPDEKSSADSQGLQSAQNLQSLQNLIDRSVASAGIVRGLASISRATISVRSQPTSCAPEMSSPRKCRRHVEKEYPNIARTVSWLAMQAASTGPATRMSLELSSTRNATMYS